MSAIVIVSGGGLKGAVAAARHREDGEIVILHVDYGQPSARLERKALNEFSGWLTGSRVVRIDVPAIARLTPSPAASGAAAALRSKDAAMSPAALRGQMPVIFSFATQYALRIGAKQVMTGLSHQGEAAHLGLTEADARVDGRRELIHAFNLLTDVVAAEGVKLAAPLIDLTYVEILKLARRFAIPLTFTRTCLTGEDQACGRCDACRARERAFIEAKAVDPLMQEPVVAQG